MRARLADVLAKLVELWFSRQHILEQMIEPSKTVASQYRNYAIALKDGRVVTGQVVYNGFRESILRIATDPMVLHQATEIRKEDMEAIIP